MNDKTLSRVELELTQKIQMHFPCGVIPVHILQAWNGCSKEVLTARLLEVFSDMSLIVRTVAVNRTRTPQQMLKATKRTEYVNDSVVEVIPAGNGNEVEVKFFNLKKYASPAEVAAAYEKYNLVPDVYAVAAVNELDPEFSDKYPNAVQWQDKNGNWCYGAFNRDGDERGVGVRRDAYGWPGVWWFGGVPKSQKLE